MTLLEDQIFINTSPSNVFNWFKSLHKNYQEWHTDHVLGKWTSGVPFEVGSIFYCEEIMHGKLHTMKFETTEVIENQLIKYKFKFPTSLICPTGSFVFELHNGGCLFIARLKFRFGLLMKTVFKSRYSAFLKHMREEGVNLKMILENVDT